jgi:hypothetical protein
MIVGEHDDACFQGPAAELKDALQRLYADPRRVDLATVPNMEHALAGEPGLEPAPQTEHAAQVDRMAVEWFARHLN